LQIYAFYLNSPTISKRQILNPPKISIFMEKENNIKIKFLHLHCRSGAAGAKKGLP